MWGLPDLNIGTTFAIFNSSGKDPWLIDRLIKCVITGEKMCILLFKHAAVMLSHPGLDSFNKLIILATSASSVSYR